MFVVRARLPSVVTATCLVLSPSGGGPLGTRSSRKPKAPALFTTSSSSVKIAPTSAARGPVGACAPRFMLTTVLALATTLSVL